MKREYPQTDDDRSIDTLDRNSQVDVASVEDDKGVHDTKTSRIAARAELAREKSQPNSVRALVLITWAACTAIMVNVAIFAVFVKDEMLISAYIAGIVAVMALLMGTLSLFSPLGQHRAQR